MSIVVSELLLTGIDNHLRKSLCSIWYKQQQEQQEHDNTSRFLSIIRKYDTIEELDTTKKP